MKKLYRVTLPETDREGRQRFLIFECDVPTLDFLIAEINDGVLVPGNALYCRPAPEKKGTYEIVRRKPMAISKGIATMIEIPDSQFREMEEPVRAA
jgi:hypothetical protein